MNFEIKIPTNANKIIHLLQHEGYSAYVVGGCVRDSILGRSPNDWDICTSAVPSEMQKVFCGYQVIETGLQHGTVTVLVDNEPYEVTTFRIDGEYSDNRRPDSVTFTTDLEADLSRRDFTINAMAYNDVVGLVDPFGGLRDLEQKIIKCVGDPNTRFEEDALRVLRALRFACQLGFSIDFTTSFSLLFKSPLLKNISNERINKELCKMIMTEHFSDIMLLYSGVLCQFIPEACDLYSFDQKNPYHDYDVWKHTSEALRNSTTTDLETRLAIFFHDFGKPFCYQETKEGVRHFKGHGKVSAEIAFDIMTRLKFDNKTLYQVTELVHYHDATFEIGNKYVKRWLNKIGPEQFRRLLTLRRADIKGQKALYDSDRLTKIDTIEQLLNSILEAKECFTVRELAIGGNDLIAIGYKPGKELGQLLSELLQLVIDNVLVNSKEELLAAAKSKLHN